MQRRWFHASLLLAMCSSAAIAADIPRPEHPTPDAVRSHWANLNGAWAFRFDPQDDGLKAGWEKPGAAGFDQSIVVPFPWESELSGIHKPDYHGVAWYRREIQVPADFPRDHHVWLRFGAVDWRADVWVNGVHVARHEGGYTPFETDITDALKSAGEKPSTLVVRVFDPTNPSQPTGKQVGWYTTTSGLWQTVWLEARPRARIARFVAVPRVAAPAASIAYTLELAGLTPGTNYRVRLRSEGSESQISFKADSDTASQALPELEWKDAKLWTPETPNLHDAVLTLETPENGPIDEVKTYFGLRTISRGRHGDAPFERVLLNGKPIYLRTALDQSFNPRGIYTAPDDAFLRQDMVLAKFFGLNGLRIHIKPDEPRRLYWADRLGVLILEDMPNTWRQNAEARTGWEATMRETIARDMNHPSIITWVAFNETWGLGSPPQYKADRDTQQWVGRMVGEIRKLDATRLVEDNSPCNFDHVENTDLNSWHFYIDDYQGARRHIDEVVDRTHPGSEFNYCPGQKQGTAPLINSEYGGVSAGGGDRDVSWCFRDLTNLLRRQPKIQGYVYTELADIEWEHNGFVNYDRSPKLFGYETWVPDMRPSELNGADFIGFDSPPVLVVTPGEKVQLPVFISHYSDRPGAPQIRWWVSGWNDDADWKSVVPPTLRPATWTDHGVSLQEPLVFEAPTRPFVGAIGLTLRDGQNQRIAANFVNLVVKPKAPLPSVERRAEREAALRFAPEDFARRHWSDGAANPHGKAYGRGKGYFEYHLRLPKAIAKARPRTIFARFELAAKAGRQKVDWPERVNPQDYPQSELRQWPSTVEATINGQILGREILEDDWADARGVLSHLKRFEHGSHGELIEFQATLTEPVQAELASGQPLILRLSVPDDAPQAGGLCLFGAETGEFPFDPTLVVTTVEPLPADLGVKPDEPVAIDRLIARRRSVLSAGGSPSPAEWSYTTTNPGAGWMNSEFDATAWKRGKAGFGTAGTPGVHVSTPWDTEQIWARTRVELPPIGDDDAITLHLFHDEDAEVFVNGKRLMRARGYVTDYREIELTAEQRALFHQGENILAVHCRQTRGGQGIDLGLTLFQAD